MTADRRPATLGASRIHNNRGVQASGIALLIMAGLSACATPPYPRQAYVSGSIQSGALAAPRSNDKAQRPAPAVVAAAVPKPAAAATTAIVAEPARILETAAGPDTTISEPAPAAVPITVGTRYLDLPPPPTQQVAKTESRTNGQAPAMVGSAPRTAGIADYQPPLDLFGNRVQPTAAAVREPTAVPRSAPREALARETPRGEGPAAPVTLVQPASPVTAEKPRSTDTGRFIAELTAPPPPQFAAAAVGLPEDRPNAAGLASLTIGFPALSGELTDRAQSELALFAQQLNANGSSQIRLVTSSSGAGPEASLHRRLALSRLFKVRDYLIGQGVESERLRLVPANVGAPLQHADTVALEIERT